MKSVMISNVVKLSPGFASAVDVADGLADDKKISGYIPTEAASEILLDAGENLHVSASRRARLVTGTYGTGKSHLALVLARLYRDGAAERCLAPVMEKLAHTWPGKAAKLQEERGSLSGQFLLVVLTGNQPGTFDDALLAGLDRSLREAGLSDLLPETAYSAARKRIEQIKAKHKDTFAELQKAIKESGVESVAALDGQLQRMQRQAYDKFCELHKVVCAGAPFVPHFDMSPAEVYAAVARALVEERKYAGVMVIWDEFGRYMERVVEDPRGIEGQSIQEFAQKACNNSHRHQVHLYLVCHRSLQEYVSLSALGRATGMSRQEQDEWTKIAGRFREFHMRSTDHEVFHLIDQVLLQGNNNTAWDDIRTKHRDYFDEITSEAVALRLFPEFQREEIHSYVTLGAYPLHPMTAFCLPKISQHVAQNERTMFGFLSDSGSDTLGPFLRETPIADKKGKLACLTADALWDYFERNVEEHPEHRKVHNRFSAASAQINHDDALEPRIIRSIALLHLIRSDRSPATEQVLRYMLSLPASASAELRETLKRLCSQESGRPKVLHQNVADGTYRFATMASGDLLEEKIERTVRDRMNLAGAGDHLRRIWKLLALDETLSATGYFDDFMLDRRLEMAAVDLVDLRSPSRWLEDLGSGQFRDGRAILVLCETGEEIREAQTQAKGPLKHPQVMVAIPKEPIRLALLLRRHEALCHLGTTQANLYGEGADLREDWEQQNADFLAAIANIVKPLVDPEKQQVEWFIGGDVVSSIRAKSQLTAAVSEMMRRVFPLTPRIAHERSVSDEGSDSPKRARRNMIGKLLVPEGPTLLAKETNAQEKTLIRAFYIDNGVLVARPNGRRDCTKPAEAANPGVCAVWSAIEKAVDEAKAGPYDMHRLVSMLRGAPYGMRIRSISPFIAAACRPYILRGNLSFEPTRGGERISRITGEALDEAVLNPEKYRLVFTDIGEKQDAILQGVAEALGVSFAPGGDRGELLDSIHAAAGAWWRGLSAFARDTRDLDRNVLVVRERVLRPLAQEDADVRGVLLEQLAEVLHPAGDKQTVSRAAVADFFLATKKTLDTAVQSILTPKVDAVAISVFAGKGRTPKTGADAMKSWFEHLPEERRTVRVAGHSSILSRKAQDAATSSSGREGIVVELAKEIAGVPLESWQDGMLERFRGMLEVSKRAIEEAELQPVETSKTGREVTIPKPKTGQISITILSSDAEGFRRTFVPVKEVSPMGENLRNIIQGSIVGIGRALPPGECETILIDVLRDTLK